MSLKTLVMMRWVSLAGSSRLFHFFSILSPLSQSLRMRRVAWNGGIAQHELRKFCARFARSARHKRVDLWAGNRVPLRLKKRDFVRLFTIRSRYIYFILPLPFVILAKPKPFQETDKGFDTFFSPELKRCLETPSLAEEFYFRKIHWPVRDGNALLSGTNKALEFSLAKNGLSHPRERKKFASFYGIKPRKTQKNALCQFPSCVTQRNLCRVTRTQKGREISWRVFLEKKIAIIFPRAW